MGLERQTSRISRDHVWPFCSSPLETAEDRPVLEKGGADQHKDSQVGGGPTSAKVPDYNPSFIHSQMHKPQATLHAHIYAA